MQEGDLREFITGFGQRRGKHSWASLRMNKCQHLSVSLKANFADCTRCSVGLAYMPREISLLCVSLIQVDIRITVVTLIFLEFFATSHQKLRQQHGIVFSLLG